MTIKQREIEREHRRQRLRRRWRTIAATGALALVGVLALGLFLLSGDEPSRSPQARPATTGSTTTSSPKKKVTKAPVKTEFLPAALARSIDKFTHRGEKAALDRFAARHKPLYCGGSKGRYVALTFDDGPGVFTQRALAILRQNHVRATFFLLGRNVPARQSVARAELSDYATLGVHAWTHISLDRLGRARTSHQITWTRRAIRKATGIEARLFRPPYGARNARVDRISRRLGMIEVLWSIDSGDSQGNNWRQVGREVLRNIKPGSIVLMHENRGQTIRALRRLILPGFKKRGLIPVTVPELLMLDPPPVKDYSHRCWEGWHPYSKSSYKK